MENIAIADPASLAKIKKAITDDGVGNFFVLADFDRTLTRAYNEKVFVSSLISVLRSGGYLAPDYAAKAQALFERYHPIEINGSVPLEEKKKAMKEWWTAHFNLLIESGLKYADLEKIADSEMVKLRSGCGDFLANLKSRRIPLVIMSSSGAGREGISAYLKKAGKFYDNIEIISNEFEWSADGRALRVKQPVIYGMNKDATAIKDFPAASEKIRNRQNALLLGDSLSDARMGAGYFFDNLLKIGFLNERVEDNIESYKENYDIVILNDGSMEYVNGLLNELFS